MNVKSLSLEEVELFSFTFSINYNISTISKYILMYDTMQADRVPTPVSLYRQTSKLANCKKALANLWITFPGLFPRSLLS